MLINIKNRQKKRIVENVARMMNVVVFSKIDLRY